eukprot:CAMPEP_0204335918 /NCGR_PEP_ID=MMETSP0469-20131031/19172_1 /ASSEMBLY_ACC=CAM_ASM_000384 /TAXON_ID=2969 /ORGANISM="Oxyrrhis marina" /LENGTH=42 /DNA_ID= /DNA_START= /DNA_END= /DNA_ORIENTATION=
MPTYVVEVCMDAPCDAMFVGTAGCAVAVYSSRFVVDGMPLHF